MRKRYRIYLPKHARWIIFPLFALIWIGLTLAVFVSEDGAKGADVTAWLMGTGVLLFVGIMIWLQTSGRWPVYIVEAEEEDSSN